MKQIIVVKPGSLSDPNKKTLQDQGIILIEHENPLEVRVINSIEGFDGDDIFQAAIEAMQSDKYNGNTDSAFAQSLFKKFRSKKK